MFRILKEMNRRPRTVYNKDGSEMNAVRWEYQCNSCKEWFPEKVKKEVLLQVDHVQPVVNPETGWVDFETWIAREFVNIDVYDPKTESKEEFYKSKIKDRLQLLCVPCHQVKSNTENAERRANKQPKSASKPKRSKK